MPASRYQPYEFNATKTTTVDRDWIDVEARIFTLSTNCLVNMSVNIPLETGKWLQSQRVLPRKATLRLPHPDTETTMLTVNKSAWIKFQNGYAIAALLKRYESKVRGTASSQNDVMDTLREAILHRCQTI